MTNEKLLVTSEMTLVTNENLLVTNEMTLVTNEKLLVTSKMTGRQGNFFGGCFLVYFGVG